MLEIEHLVRYKTILYLIFFLNLSNFVFAQRFPDQEVNRLLDHGIEYVLNHNYELAEKKFSLLDARFPKIPLGKIYLAMVEISKASDLGGELESDSILKSLDKALLLSENLLEKNPADIWNNYFVALCNGYKAYIKILNGEWLSAISTGLNSVKYFENCLEIDSTFYESYVVLGTYKFWKSRKLEFLEWLPFVDDESEIAIQYLETAINNSSYNRNFAVVSLIWIYIERNNYSLAIMTAERELKRNPFNRNLKWALARAYEEINLRKSIEIYHQLLTSYTRIPSQNHFQEITLKHIIAQQHLKIGEKREALRLCDEILSTNNLQENVRKRLEDRLDRVKELKKELND